MAQPVASKLDDTRAAFDSVAADYDGPRGNNELIQDMRAEMWRWFDRAFPAGSRILDLGCGTGIDAVRMAKLGHRVMATDFSSGMVARTRERAEREQVTDAVQAAAVGAHELALIEGRSCFDGAYSNLGPLNCIPDPGALARECARLVRPGGTLVFTVIGRLCPWEIAHYVARGRWHRAGVRFRRGLVPVGMNGRTVWTHYYTPRELYRAFAAEFDLVHYRGLCIFAPPPYLASVRERHPRAYEHLWRLDRLLAGCRLLRSTGDHFLIVMRRRGAQAGA
jgi:SAM-dependent methyltransferase